MAVVTAYRAVDMFSPTIYYGNVVSYDASHITLSDGVRTGTYYGTFSYSSVGLVGGTITGYDAYLNGVLTLTARQGNVDALIFNGYLSSGDADGANSYALRFADNLNGSVFDDKIRGYSGSDIIYGGTGGDLLQGDNGNDTLTGNAGADILNGVGGNDSLLGSGGRDALNGGTRGDLLDGGTHNDSLTGGGGADKFNFTTALSANVDRITDFNADGDLIQLDTDIFIGLAGGTLAAHRFHSAAGATAGHDPSDRILYNTNSGRVYYDPDGDGGDAAIHFATLTGAPAITAADFFVIA